MRTFAAFMACAAAWGEANPTQAPITLDWNGHILSISAPWIPGKSIEVWYIEAYCRPNSHEADWRDTVIGHETRLVSRSPDGQRLELECTLKDGVVARHTIEAGADEVTFEVAIHNPTDTPSQAHWAQPCIRVGGFTGRGDPENPSTYAYLAKSFVFIDGELETMPTRDWAEHARYTPGQVWAAPGVDEADVNPRPLNSHRPSNGLIGCFSKDDSYILAAAWAPYQELFQGIITCLHSDFRIGGLAPNERKTIRGKLYIVPNHVKGLLERYAADFPESAEKEGG